MVTSDLIALQKNNKRKKKQISYKKYIYLFKQLTPCKSIQAQGGPLFTVMTYTRTDELRKYEDSREIHPDSSKFEINSESGTVMYNFISY